MSAETAGFWCPLVVKWQTAWECEGFKGGSQARSSVLLKRSWLAGPHLRVLLWKV